MQAAAKLFKSRRFHEVTTDDIAREARIGKGTIYRYFADKDDLFFQTATHGFDDLCDLLHKRVPENAPFAEQLLHACIETSNFFAGRTHLFRLMHAEGARLVGRKGNLRDRWKEKRKRLVAVIAAILAKGVAEGRIRTDIHVNALAGFLLGMLRTRSHDLADAPDDVRRLELVVDLFCRGARPLAPAGQSATVGATDTRCTAPLNRADSNICDVTSRGDATE